jgi:hypothetical protein
MKRLKNVMNIIEKVALLFLFFLIPLFYAPSEIFAQDTAQEDITENPLDEKDWALQFEIDNNFTLRSFQGTVISAKYHMDAQKALRLGINLDLAKGSQKNNELDAGVEDNSKVEGSVYAINTTLQYVRYPKPKRRILYFYGAGPFFEYTADSYSFEENNSYNNEEKRIWGLGISAVVGVEWFVTHAISLLGEYGVRAGYYSTKETYEEVGWTREVDKITAKEFIFEPLPVKFGLSVYF